MKVRELMTGSLITARPDTPMLEARQLMVRRADPPPAGHGREARDLLGIVTDRDIRLNLPSRATSLSVWEINHLLSRLTVGSVMTTSVMTVAPDRHATRPSSCSTTRSARFRWSTGASSWAS